MTLTGLISTFIYSLSAGGIFKGHSPDFLKFILMGIVLRSTLFRCCDLQEHEPKLLSKDLLYPHELANPEPHKSSSYGCLDLLSY